MEKDHYSMMRWSPTLTFSDNAGLEQFTLQQPATPLLKKPVRLLINGSDLFTAAAPEEKLSVTDSLNHVALSCEDWQTYASNYDAGWVDATDLWDVSAARLLGLAQFVRAGWSAPERPVAMAWYGVNFVLGEGLHRDGFGVGGVGYAIAYVIIKVVFVTTVAIRYKVLKSAGKVKNAAEDEEFEEVEA